jgi:hypothetical protein
LFLHPFATVLTHWQTILACLIVIWNNISVVILVFSFPDLPGKMTKTLNAVMIILVHVNIHVMYTRIQMKYIYIDLQGTTTWSLNIMIIVIITVKMHVMCARIQIKYTFKR